MKKIIFTILIFIIPMIRALACTPGDANGDNQVSIIDALMTAQHYVGLNPPGFSPLCADSDCSGTVTIVDALMIAQFYVGLFSQFPCTPLPTPTGQPGTPEPGEKKIICYFTAWGIYGRAFFPSDIPFDKVTHINYAFANIVNGEIALGDSYADVEKAYPGDVWDEPLKGNFKQLNVVYKTQFPHLKTLISVGGWTWSDNFSDVALTTESRQKFAASCINFITKYKFDGIDIDWEYPDGGGEPGNIVRPEDPANFTLLMEELRNQLDVLENAEGREYYLTVAASAGVSHINNLDLQALSRSLDWINIMTYDFAGSWDNRTGHHSALFASSKSPNTSGLNCDAAVKAYLQGGFPAEKLNLGLPLYGRAWGGVSGGENGLGQAATQSVSGSYGESGYFDYSDILNNGYPEFFDSEAMVPWKYSSQTGVFITYDNPVSIQHKGQYVLANHLGGLMLWEFSGDKTMTLLNAAYNSIQP